MDNWSKCPRCESGRVQKISKWMFALAMFASAGCLIWIGILFPPLWFAVPVLLVLSIVMLFGKDTWQCQDCKHSWAVKRGNPA